MTINNHPQKITIMSVFREVVFGMEDGMVSTLGAITGIAIGSQDHFIILLSGLVIISVESISMGIGSFLSNKSEEDLNEQIINEEEEEIREYPDHEKAELKAMFIRDGWPKRIAHKMSSVAAHDKKLILKEMTYREHGIVTNSQTSPIVKGIFMSASYIIGGLIPLIAYFFFPVKIALPVSILITLLGLFGLGAYTSTLTKKSLLMSGSRMLILGGIALTVGLLVGEFARSFNVPSE